jgi:hypothetical protein
MLDISKHICASNPIIVPPNTDPRVPITVTPPLVPGGTDFPVVIKTVLCEFREKAVPNSLANVSPEQQE